MKRIAVLLLTSTLVLADKEQATAVRQKMGREKVVTFSKDYLIKSGLDAKDIATWDATLKKVQGMITDKPLANADTLFASLDTANSFVKKTVQELHDRYSKNYAKEQEKYIPTFKASEIQPTTIQDLEQYKKRAQQLRKMVLEVTQQAFSRSYIEAASTPAAWEKTYIKGKSAEQLLPNYQKLINDYSTSKDYASFKTKFGTKYTLKAGDAKSFNNLLENIERCKYQLEHKKSPILGIPLSPLEQTNIKTLKSLAKNIRKEFPTSITTLDLYKITNDPSVQRAVLSAYAEAMEGVLNQIIRETGTLIDAARKTR
jgi:hypothetical protein